MSQSIIDYYKYAALATASYVRMGGLPLDGARFAERAADPELSGGRLPLVLGQYLFDPQPERPNLEFWGIKYYYGGDVPANIDPIAYSFGVGPRQHTDFIKQGRDLGAKNRLERAFS